MAKSPAAKPPAPQPPELRVLPVDLRLGDRLVDERAECQVIGRPYTTAGVKMAHARVESVKPPGVTNSGSR